MTTEVVSTVKTRGRRWPFALSCVLAIGIWFGGLAAAVRIFEPTGGVIVIAGSRSAAIASVTAADVVLLDASGDLITVAGRSRGFVGELYAAGAWLVLPASGGGCRSGANGLAARISSVTAWRRSDLRI